MSGSSCICTWINQGRKFLIFSNNAACLVQKNYTRSIIKNNNDPAAVFLGPLITRMASKKRLAAFPPVTVRLHMNTIYNGHYETRY